MSFLYCLIYLISISITVFLLGRFYPRKSIHENAFPFRSFAFEREGKIYEKIKIRKWKTKWPDASLFLHKIIPTLSPRKRLDNEGIKKVPTLIKETCVAESTHMIAGLLGFACIGIWKKSGGVVLSILYAFINLPPILIQRYNRPRLKRALNLEK